MMKIATPREEYFLRCPKCKSADIGEHSLRIGTQSTKAIKCFDCGYQDINTNGAA